MQLDKHLVVFANPRTVKELQHLSPNPRGVSAALRALITDEHAAWRDGAPQPPPLGEFRGTRADRKTITIRCSTDDLLMAEELSQARRVSVSKMIRDMIARAMEKLPDGLTR